MTKPILIGLAFLAACSIDKTVGSVELSDTPDAPLPPPPPPPDAHAAASPLIHGGASTILFDGDDMIFDTDAGPEASAAGLYRMTPDGVMHLLVADIRGYMAEDSDRFYVASYIDGTSHVLAIDKTTLAVTELAATAGSVNSIVADDQSVYVDYDANTCSACDNPMPDGKVIRIAKEGSGADVMLDGLDAPFGLAVDDDFVYVAEDLTGRVLALPKTGEPAFVLVTGANRPAGLLLVGDWLYFTERGNTLTDGTIARILRPAHSDHGPTGSPETLVTGLGHPTWMAVENDTLYWTAYFSGLQSAPLEGGTADTILGCYGDDEPLGEPNWPQGCGALAIHGDQAYFAARDPQNAGALYRVPR